MTLEWPQNALGQLNARQPELFRRLQIIVKHFRGWTIDDAARNGGVFLSADNAPREVAEIASRLKQMRTYYVRAFNSLVSLCSLLSHNRRTAVQNYASRRSTPWSLPRYSTQPPVVPILQFTTPESFWRFTPYSAVTLRMRHASCRTRTEQATLMR